MIITTSIMLIIFLGVNVSSLTIKAQRGGDWPVDLIGVSSISVTKQKFESWVDVYETCWSDGDHTWCGVPLWRVASMVDDPEPEDYSFNEELAALGYVVKLTSWDGWVTELEISDVAHNDNGFIIVNTIDGQELPEYTPSGRPSYPLHLRGSDIFPPNNVGGIIKIELIGIESNSPPETPEISGTTNGKTGTSYTYYFSTTDPEENNVYYYIDWDDGSNSGWYGPYKSGDEKSLSHAWDSDGTYNIKIKAKDTSGEESDWNTLEVTMPRTMPFNSMFLKLLERLPHAFQLLRYILGLYQ